MLIGSEAFFPAMYARKKERVTNSAEKKDATIPMDSVTAKPRTGPVPNWKRIKAVIRVVMWHRQSPTGRA